MKGMGSPPTRASLFIGDHRIYPLQLLAPYNTPKRLYPEKFAKRLRRSFR
jgi:hypothetical protein